MSRIIDEVTRDKVAVMTAYLMKKAIEVRVHADGSILSEMCGAGWHDVVSEPSWNWDRTTWRIKPEGVSVGELIRQLQQYDVDLRVNLNFENQNFDIDSICQDDDILDIFPESVAR